MHFFSRFYFLFDGRHRRSVSHKLARPIAQYGNKHQSEIEQYNANKRAWKDALAARRKRHRAKSRLAPDCMLTLLHAASNLTTLEEERLRQQQRKSPQLPFGPASHKRPMKKPRENKKENIIVIVIRTAILKKK